MDLIFFQARELECVFNDFFHFFEFFRNKWLEFLPSKMLVEILVLHQTLNSEFSFLISTQNLSSFLDHI